MISCRVAGGHLEGGRRKEECGTEGEGALMWWCGARRFVVNVRQNVNRLGAKVGQGVRRMCWDFFLCAPQTTRRTQRQRSPRGKGAPRGRGTVHSVCNVACSAARTCSLLLLRFSVMIDWFLLKLWRLLARMNCTFRVTKTTCTYTYTPSHIRTHTVTHTCIHTAGR